MMPELERPCPRCGVDTVRRADECPGDHPRNAWEAKQRIKDRVVEAGMAPEDFDRAWDTFIVEAVMRIDPFEMFGIQP